MGGISEMKKKTRRKILYALATFSSMISSPGAYAKISPLAFKGVTKCFKKGKEFFSPTVGEAALESGLLYDLRFYGNFEAAHREEGGVETRDYIQDSSSDPVWNVVKTLFPSSGGQLSSESTFLTSFGKVVDNPQSIAVLLNFANKLREEESVDEAVLQDTFLATLSPAAMGTKAAEHETLEALMADLQSISLVDKNGQSITKVQLEKEVNGILQKHNLTRLQSQVKKEINKFAAARAQGRLEEKLGKAKESSMTLLKTSLERDIKKKEETFQKQFTKETLSPLVAYLKDAMAGEKDALYPERTTEQVLLAFFCYKFNSQEDIWELLRHLDGDIVDHSMIPTSTDELKEADLQEIATHDVYDLDDILDLETADIWSQITPYREGSPLLSNGNAYKYDRSKDQLLKEETTFADCQEITLRHLMNLLFYDFILKGWNLSHIEKHLQENDPENPYFKNVREFYAAQGPSLANAGDTDMRSLFNKVVGDLNADGKGPEIHYMKGTNELNAGFINMMRLFEKLFSLPLKPFPTPLQGKPKESFEAKREWLEKSLELLFKTLNPTRAFQLDLSKLKETGDEISGDLSVTVEDEEIGEQLFSFNIYSEVNRHAQIMDLKQLKKTEKRDYTEELQSHPLSLQEGTAEEALWLLSSNPTLKAQKVRAPLYALFHTPLTDNDSRIQFLETLSKNFPTWVQEPHATDQQLAFLRSVLKNILENISWDDQAVVKKASPHIWSLLEREELKRTLFSSVGGLSFNNKEKLEHLSNFTNFHYLYASSLAVEELSLKGLEALKSLNLSWSAAKKISLETLTQLEKLNLDRTRNLEELSLKGLEALKSLNLSWSAVKKIGLETLTQLESLNLSGTEKLEELSLKGCEALKSLNLLSSAAKKISLETLTQLENLDLRCTRNLEELSLKGCEALKSLDLSWSDVKKIEGLETCPQLENLDLGRTEKLEELLLVDLSSLKSLAFKGSAVQRLVLKNLKSLGALDLSSLTNLTSVRFEGDFSALQSVTFANSTALESIEGIDCLWHKDITFGFKGSGIQDRTQIKGIDLDDEKLHGLAT